MTMSGKTTQAILTMVKRMKFAGMWGLSAPAFESGQLAHEFGVFGSAHALLDRPDDKLVLLLQQGRDIQPQAGKNFAFDDPFGFGRTPNKLSGGPLEPVEPMVQGLPDDILPDLVGMISALLLEKIIARRGSSDFENQLR